MTDGSGRGTLVASVVGDNDGTLDGAADKARAALHEHLEDRALGDGVRAHLHLLRVERHLHRLVAQDLLEVLQLTRKSAGHGGEATADGIEAASVISRQCQTSVGVIQAAMCVFQMCPTERSQTAAGILAMQLKDFPKSLHKLLEQEVSNSSRMRTASAAGLP